MGMGGPGDAGAIWGDTTKGTSAWGPGHLDQGLTVGRGWQAGGPIPEIAGRERKGVIGVKWGGEG